MEQSTPGVSSKLSNAWYVALAIGCCLILAYGFLYSKNTTDDIDHLVGYNLPLALILWGVFHMIFGRKKGGVAAGIAFVFIFSCLMMKSFIGYERNARAMNEVMSSIPRDIAEFMDGAVDEQGVPKRIERLIDTTPIVTGEMGEVQRWVRKTLNRQVEIRNAYFSEMEAVGWPKLVDADRLKADTTLKESFSIIEKGKSAAQKYKIQNDALFDEARNELKTLDIAEGSKHKYAPSLEKLILESWVHFDASLRLEEQAMVQFENVVKLLAARKGKWIVQDRQISFESQEDHNAFNAYLERVRQLAQQQLLLQQKRDEATLASFEKLKQ